MRREILLAVVSLLVASLAAADRDASDSAQEPFRFFQQYVGLSDNQIQEIRRGKAVAKVLESSSPDDVYVFGSVHVQGNPESYLKLASDVDSLRKLPSYLAIQKFSEPPKLSDLQGFTLEEEDVKQVKNCKPGHCEIQLPAESMEEFQKSIRWSEPDVADQVNRLGQSMALRMLDDYRKGGNTALGTYRDKNHPADVAETFQSLLSRAKGLPVYLPELNRYLLEYPSANTDNISSEFYWEKVNFGLKPTLRIVQAIVYRGTEASKPAYAVAVKQLYSSHYFETALDMTVCVKDAESTDPAFYLITLKGSRQAGLTGFKGGIVRKVAVDKTRSSLEKALVAIKQKLETPASAKEVRVSEQTGR